MGDEVNDVLLKYDLYFRKLKFYLIYLVVLLIIKIFLECR